MVSAEEGEAGHRKGQEESSGKNDEDRLNWRRKKKLVMTRQPCEENLMPYQPHVCKIKRLSYSHRRCLLL